MSLCQVAHTGMQALVALGKLQVAALSHLQLGAVAGDHFKAEACLGRVHIHSIVSEACT